VNQEEAVTEEVARTLINRLLDGLDRGDITVMDEVFHDDAVMEWPASREQLVGAANRREVYARTKVLPKTTDRHIYGSGDLWVLEATMTYGTKPYAAILVFRLRDGKIARQVGYWAEPSDPPEWRSPWIKRLDPAHRD
jgi:ketosteroid isomerase-like protein